MQCSPRTLVLETSVPSPKPLPTVHPVPCSIEFWMCCVNQPCSVWSSVLASCDQHISRFIRVTVYVKVLFIFVVK